MRVGLLTVATVIILTTGVFGQGAGEPSPVPIDISEQPHIADIKGNVTSVFKFSASRGQTLEIQLLDISSIKTCDWTKWSFTLLDDFREPDRPGKPDKEPKPDISKVVTRVSVSDPSGDRIQFDNSNHEPFDSGNDTTDVQVALQDIHAELVKAGDYLISISKNPQSKCK